MGKHTLALYKNQTLNQHHRGHVWYPCAPENMTQKVRPVANLHFSYMTDQLLADSTIMHGDSGPSKSLSMRKAGSNFASAHGIRRTTPSRPMFDLRGSKHNRGCSATMTAYTQLFLSWDLHVTSSAHRIKVGLNFLLLTHCDSLVFRITDLQRESNQAFDSSPSQATRGERARFPTPQPAS